MKLAAISMIRDEADIIVPFLRHLDALFDIVILLDQRSSDGTEEVMRAACAQRADWEYVLCDFGGRHQKEAANMLMARAFALGADVVFFLDFGRVHPRPIKIGLASTRLEDREPSRPRKV